MSDDVKRELDEAVDRVLASKSSKKLVVAGPGAGKTTLFRKLLDGSAGSADDRLVLTFINNLKADLEGSLGDAAGVFTLHGYCQQLLRRHKQLRDGLSANFRCYPGLASLIKQDHNWPRLRSGFATGPTLPLGLALACPSASIQSIHAAGTVMPRLIGLIVTRSYFGRTAFGSLIRHYSRSSSGRASSGGVKHKQKDRLAVPTRSEIDPHYSLPCKQFPVAQDALKRPRFPSGTDSFDTLVDRAAYACDPEVGHRAYMRPFAMRRYRRQ